MYGSALKESIGGNAEYFKGTASVAFVRARAAMTRKVEKVDGFAKVLKEIATDPAL